MDHTLAHKQGLAYVLGVPVEEIEKTLLRTLDQRTADLSAFDPAYPTTINTLIRKQWVRWAGSPACRPCLEQDDYVWRLAWKTMYVFGCPRHEVLLADRCPGCQQPTGHVRDDRSILPAMLANAPTPAL